MTNVHRSYTVIPSESTPTSKITLSHCDQLKSPNHVSQLYVYSTSTSSPSSSSSSSSSLSSFKSSVETLRTSLSKALNIYYPLAGRLCWIQGNRLELLCNSKGIILLEATCDDSRLDDFGGDSVLLPPHVADKLVPKVDYGAPIEAMPLMVVQVTGFSCGGITLGLMICRAVVDGTGLGNFMSSWSKLARGVSLDSNLLPVLDRTVLDSLGLNVAPRFEHAEFLPPPIWVKGRLEQQQQTQVRDFATAILRLTKWQVEKLKKIAYDGFGNGGSKPDIVIRRPYTSFEVIGGHLWRCLCKARYESTNGAQPTRSSILVNCRNRLKPPLPQSYLGNATFPTVTKTCSFDDIVHKPLSYAVGKLREAIDRMNDEYVRSAINYIANQKDMNFLKNNLYNLGAGGGGNPNLYLVSWTNFPYYDTDFGWGKPDYMLPGNFNSDGKGFIMNNGSRGDGFIVAICLQPSQVDAFKKLFYEDIDDVKPSSRL